MRRRARQFAFVLGAAALMIMFQNCGKPMAVGEHSLDNQNAIGSVTSDIHSLMVYPTVGANDSSLQSKAQQDESGETSSSGEVRYVVPKAIEFGFNRYDRRVKNADGTASIIRGSDQALYHLDLQSGDVTEIGSNRLLLSLEQEDRELLKVMFEGSAIANQKDFLANDVMCTLAMKQAYAHLLTDEGEFSLGHGNSGCSFTDLFKVSIQESAGLGSFLNRLETKLK